MSDISDFHKSDIDYVVSLFLEMVESLENPANANKFVDDENVAIVAALLTLGVTTSRRFVLE